MGFNQEQLDKITSLAKVYGATRLILFGSANENPDTARDVDLACDGVLGWKMYELAAKLEDEIHLPLDLVPLTPANRFTEMIVRKGRRLI